MAGFEGFYVDVACLAAAAMVAAAVIVAVRAPVSLAGRVCCIMQFAAINK